MSTQTQAKPRATFTGRTLEIVSGQLNQLNQIYELAWEFSDDGESIKIEGLPHKDLAGNQTVNEITISHPRSAVAFLDGYLFGYDSGFSDARGRDWTTDGTTDGTTDAN
jgi:hypothetical protein